MPSPRPVKPSFSLVVALQQRVRHDAGKFCNIRAHTVAMFADTRGFTHDSEIEIAIRPPRVRTRSDGKRQKAVGGDATTLRLAQEENAPDVAVGESPRIASVSACSATSASEWPVRA